MAAAIDPRATVGPVALTVRDVDIVADLYVRVLGLGELERDGDVRRLGTAAGREIVGLTADPGAPPRPPGTTGLFHLALLVPSRAELARSLRRIVDARWPLAGASDHLVSEALYIGDPEGNGIEIYADRPRETWGRSGGELEMATLPLDVRDLLAEPGAGADAPEWTDPGLAADARMGHVHLNVADLGAAEAFYAGLLGLEVTARGYPGALFLSAGGYHHHIGLNTWQGAGAPAPPEGAAGLREFELTLPDPDGVEEAVASLRAAGIDVAVDDGAARTSDPSGNRIVLRSAA